jgi:hypothetical protein
MHKKIDCFSFRVERQPGMPKETQKGKAVFFRHIKSGFLFFDSFFDLSAV